MSKSIIYTERKSDFTNIASNSSSAVQLGTNGTLYAIRLRFLKADGTEATVAQIKSEVTEVTLRYNSTAIVNWPAKELFEEATRRGVVVSEEDGVLPIVFALPSIKGASPKRLFAHGLAGLSNATLELQFGTVQHIAKAEVYVEKTDEQRTLGVHYRLVAHPFSSTVGGKFQITTLPKQPDLAYEAIHIGEGASAIKSVELKADTRVWVDNVPASVQKDILRNADIRPTAGFYSVIFNKMGEPEGALQTAGVNDLSLTVNFEAAPGNFNVYTREMRGLAVK